jgi:hypothetical protein
MTPYRIEIGLGELQKTPEVVGGDGSENLQKIQPH